jgi:predicted nucleotidyltransferase
VTRAEIQALLSRELPARIPGLAAAYLFGSVARGTDTERSDVDVGLVYEAPIPSTLEAQPFLVAGDLEDLLGRPVDLVVLETAPVDLVHRVLRDGILAFEGNRSRRIAFEVRARNQYFDLLPYLLRYRREVVPP